MKQLVRGCLAVLGILTTVALGFAVFVSGLLAVLGVTLLLRLVFTPLAALAAGAGVLWWAWRCKVFLDELGEEVKDDSPQ